MLVEGEYDESLGKQEDAASVYHALFEMFPDNLDYGLRLTSVLTGLGHSSRAMDAIHQMRSLPPPSSNDPRIDLAESQADWRQIEGTGAHSQRDHQVVVRG